jgi:hypothetical protein
LFIAFLNFANAGEMYNCTDSDGNTIVTNIPQDGMKCALKESYEAPSPEELAIEKERATVEKDKAIVKKKITPGARIKNCISCCTNKQLRCFNFTSDSRLCSAEIKNCYATCDSEGISPSSWSNCWSQSDK